MSEIDQLFNFVIQQKQFPIQNNLVNKQKRKKSLRKLCIIVNPYIKYRLFHHQSLYLTILNKLANTIFPQLKLRQKSYSKLNQKLSSVKVNITDQYDFIAAQQGLACSENGFLLNQNIETDFKIVYTPASTTLEKQIRIIEENELQQIIDLNFHFTL
ncbi:unnamed protein product [Paramecium pentaurelia]|uniref:Uncharacterized protein n=1 Tax=Paramecium pentaurelia TaxID=43138 RepID=A0A8S1YB66_9CILI|nr:unnamed protein product [Paramecium pentaurelia]